MLKQINTEPSTIENIKKIFNKNETITFTNNNSVDDNEEYNTIQSLWVNPDHDFEKDGILILTEFMCMPD